MTITWPDPLHLGRITEEEKAAVDALLAAAKELSLDDLRDEHFAALVEYEKVRLNVEAIRAEEQNWKGREQAACAGVDALDRRIRLLDREIVRRARERAAGDD